MKKIKSFEVDHTKMDRGLYVSRIDGDIITYDIRMVKPNTPPYLENDGIHTFEHLFATFVRNSEYSEKIIYVGPMGCRTGFYFLVRNLSYEVVKKLVQDTLEFIYKFSGEIPGVSIEECGNYLDHNLDKARKYAKSMYDVLSK